MVTPAPVPLAVHTKGLERRFGDIVAVDGVDLAVTTGEIYGFLTTQYLEEADVLADRVGIIARGRIVAEGTPDELKRSVGTDLIVARIAGDAEVARRALDGIEGVGGVEVHGDELTVSATDGPAALSPVAVALSQCGVTVRELTLRRPTLDDVFLELTGGHIHEQEEAA